ncbi:hypothetical protein RND81_05G180800 [Saponaria officinalis]|uniref:DUF1618 domain-containing protein n=1 Tax=Saponaria officinalis TaxID=3572 RepID=A0AAW1KZW0_SAPOF
MLGSNHQLFFLRRKKTLIEPKLKKKKKKMAAEEKRGSKFESGKSMAFFLMEEKRGDHTMYRVYVVHKDTLKLYHVVDFTDIHPKLGRVRENIACVFHRGKLYLVGDRHADDVHVCDLLHSPPPYVWKPGPSLRCVKPDPHLVAYDGMIFVLSNPPSDFGDDMPTFEVWDTKTDCCCWVVLPDPPLKGFNSTDALYKLVSHTVLDALIYFVFDSTDFPECVPETSSRFRTRVEAFDPNLRQWVSSSSSGSSNTVVDTLSLYVDFSAHRHEGGVQVLEFFEGDPSLRMFLIDLTGDIQLSPCLYTYDLSTFDSKDLLKAMRDLWPPCLSAMTSHHFFNWFQELVRPYLSGITGLLSLVEMIKGQPNRSRHCFVLPSSYHQNSWIFCIVAFIQSGGGINCFYCVTTKFRLKMMNPLRAIAEDVEMRIEELPDPSNFPRSFSRIP